jgi:hypothetical protein
MYRSDIDRSRSFLRAFLRGSKIRVTPGTVEDATGAQVPGFTVSATADTSVLVDNLIAWRRGKDGIVHDAAPYPG